MTFTDCENVCVCVCMCGRFKMLVSPSDPVDKSFFGSNMEPISKLKNRSNTVFITFIRGYLSIQWKAHSVIDFYFFFLCKSQRNKCFPKAKRLWCL